TLFPYTTLFRSGFGDRCATNCATPLRGSGPVAEPFGHTATGVTHPTAHQCTGTSRDSPTRAAAPRSGQGGRPPGRPSHREHLLARAGDGQVDLGAAVG